ncbi:MAG: Unknown protein [uncultured Sulfurovum sp.]|uniref:J domain-containing protein n=1 Tax=uncultured Sulfurovum sp. TaxID=269237 RepID=A0A6S6U6B4_9BACT|nr:MAG: Unknown protein [uncultured Sulfurovum sp.]
MHSKKTTCTRCDKNNNSNNNFCIYCGIKLVKEKKKIKEEEVSPKNANYNNIRNNYDGLFISLLSKVAKVDGGINPLEAEALGKVFDELSRFRQDIFNIRDIYKQILTNEKDKLDNVIDICNALVCLKITNYDKISFIQSLLTLSYINESINHHNENLIIKIIVFLDIDFSFYLNIKSEFEPQQKTEDSSFTGKHLSLAECYNILEVTNNESHQSIKQSYRKMVRNYHADILSSKDLPSDMLGYAEEKLKKINRAYEILKQHKGIK